LFKIIQDYGRIEGKQEGGERFKKEWLVFHAV
jgi:hypothetical protein